MDRKTMKIMLVLLGIGILLSVSQMASGIMTVGSAVSELRK